jgi:hypothetical protein
MDIPKIGYNRSVKPISTMGQRDLHPVLYLFAECLFRQDDMLYNLADIACFPLVIVHLSLITPRCQCDLGGHLCQCHAVAYPLSLSSYVYGLTPGPSLQAERGAQILAFIPDYLVVFENAASDIPPLCFQRGGRG